MKVTVDVELTVYGLELNVDSEAFQQAIDDALSDELSDSLGLSANFDISRADIVEIVK